MTHPLSHSERRFRRFGILTIASVFFLIFVGGLVRSTGSGMGCPDWPKCFGQWVPPTDVSQLPPDYQTKFAVANHTIAEFDVFKTWTEYINRLIGVLIGLFIFFTVLFAIPFLKNDAIVFWLSFLAFVLVGFQGWIGAKVVSSNLAHWMVTIHMLIALCIVGLLIYTISRSQQFVVVKYQPDDLVKWMVILTLGLILTQTLLGTQVRENIDIVAIQSGEVYRSQWISMLGDSFYFHRSLSLLCFASIAYMSFLAKKVYSKNSLIFQYCLVLILLTSIQIGSGKILDNFGVPKMAQSAHLFIGSLIAGTQLFIAILAFTKTEKNIRTA